MKLVRNAALNFQLQTWTAKLETGDWTLGLTWSDPEPYQ